MLKTCCLGLLINIEHNIIEHNTERLHIVPVNVSYYYANRRMQDIVTVWVGV